MDGTVAAQEVEPEDPSEASPSTFPETTNFSMHGMEEAEARKIAYNLAEMFREIGRRIDISNLDGITIAWDYDKALAELDRGYQSVHVLTRTTDVGTGVAMTPSVLRDGTLKSHILFHAHVANFVQSEDVEDIKFVLHTIAHECAHVEITAAYDKCFPGELLRATHATLLHAYHEQVFSACWDEYAATRISGTIGYDPMPGYEETFISVLEQIDDKVAELVKGFHGRTPEETDAFVGSVFGAYGTLLKFGCYYLGTLASVGRKGDPGEKILEALAGSWLRPYFFRIEDLCSELFETFGRWSDKDGFEAIGNLIEEIVEDRSMTIHRGSGGRYGIYVHHINANT
ncbi:hypothetical protein [Rhizobium sp.]|uniref:hypothetical protein n=1 Tax=Rhizobium sp. TaxID=391 RepID=UPI0028AFB922